MNSATCEDTILQTPCQQHATCIAQNPQTLNPERQGFRCGALTSLDLPRSSVLGLYYTDNRNTNIANTGHKNHPLKAGIGVLG